MSTWLLLMMILSSVPGIEQNTILNRFDTPEECQIERNRIGFDMAAAYPYEADFRIECHEHKVSTQINYTAVIRKWVDTLHPGFWYSITIPAVKPLGVVTEGSHVPPGALAFQVIVTYANGNEEAYIAFIGEGDIGVFAFVQVVVPEDTNSDEFSFPDKDRT